MSEGVTAGRAVRPVDGLALTPGMSYAEARRILEAAEDIQVDDDMERPLAPARLRRRYVASFGFSIITNKELKVLARTLQGKRLLEVGLGLATSAGCSEAWV